MKKTMILDRLACVGCYAVLVVLLGAGGCRALPMPGSSDAVPLWGRWEQAFTAEAGTDPETTLQVLLTAPSGKLHQVDGFWDGGLVWKVRFMPDEAGPWRYRTEAIPASGLAGRKGRFEAVRSAVPLNRFMAHGAVQVSANGRYLEHVDGTPFFWLGDTAWNGALRAGDAEWRLYLGDRVGKAFSVIQFVTTQWRAAYEDAEGQVAYTGFEHIDINPAFFRRLDARVDAINEMGLLAAPVVLWALGEPAQVPGKLPEDQAIRLARYIVARYGANHVAWLLGGDENYSEARGERWRRIGRAVFDTDDHAPVTLHPQGMQWHFESFKNEPWLDFLIYQSGHGDSPETLQWIHSGPPAQRWRDAPARPVINSEPPYEGHIAYQSKQPHTAYNVRRAVYWSLLSAPTAGVTYGAHGIWSWEKTPQVPLNHNNAGVAQPWNVAMNLPGSEDMRHVADLFTSLRWWELRPAQDVLAAQPGQDDPARFIGVAATADQEQAVVYLPVGGTVQFTQAFMDKQRNAAWYDPRTGEQRPAQATAPRVFTAPDTQDWILLFR